MPPPRDPDSGKGKIVPATAADRDRAATAVIKRDLDAALATERPVMDPPRTKTPADNALAAAIDQLRAADPQWHVAEQAARVADALGAKAAEIEDRVAALEDVLATIRRLVSRLKTWIAGSLVATAGSIAAVIYGAGVKAGHADTIEAERRAQVQRVEAHGRQIQCLRGHDAGHASRLDEHDHILGLPSRRSSFTDCNGESP